ncbi:hypothetical protein ACQP00_50035 [Dactylosporangium sp. CS-047395]|uniref:hypothetical protein n=1 Tax=Dactylosporangium sp. CS-047395 TaxID=3239936 RepID=UPI003D933AA5
MMADEIPEHWAPNSTSRVGPAAVVLTVLTGIAWLLLGVDGLIYRDSLDEPEGLGTFAAGLAGLVGSAVTLVITVATAAVAGYHRAVSERRWALVVAVTATVLALALCGGWGVVFARQ